MKFEVIKEFATNFAHKKMPCNDVALVECRESVCIFDITPTGFVIVREESDGFRVVGYSESKKFASNPIVDQIILMSEKKGRKEKSLSC